MVRIVDFVEIAAYWLEDLAYSLDSLDCRLTELFLVGLRDFSAGVPASDCRRLAAPLSAVSGHHGYWVSSRPALSRAGS